MTQLSTGIVNAISCPKYNANFYVWHLNWLPSAAHWPFWKIPSISKWSTYLPTVPLLTPNRGRLNMHMWVQFAVFAGPLTPRFSAQLVVSILTSARGGGGGASPPHGSASNPKRHDWGMMGRDEVCGGGWRGGEVGIRVEVFAYMTHV